MEYQFQQLEAKAKEIWEDLNVYHVSNKSNLPKFYILDMFPYPSGAGLHVGHPLGYIASDIYARYKKMKGFNVLHPMGFDAFGLPAEQYAIETGQHPADTTQINMARYREQLDNIGFCYDWERSICTADKNYYKWTQWIFLQLFNSYFDRKQQKAQPINVLIKAFEQEGNCQNPCPGNATAQFTATDWAAFSEKEQQNILMQYRLAYCDYGEVNWCEALGTVLANDEVVNGLSERGSHPVVKKKLRQWYLRITEYADRLLLGLEQVEFSEAMKEMQRNWIGKSSGASVVFQVQDAPQTIEVFTTRPDTLYGVDFIVVAPEAEWLGAISSTTQKAAIEAYQNKVKSRSERERMAEKEISGCFTGAYAIHPLSGKLLPIWTSEYVLAAYGTGAIMAVPCGDDRDHKFAQHFNIPITNIFGALYQNDQAFTGKDFVLENSAELNGLAYAEATTKILELLQQKGIGTVKVNYKMRDAAFSRQRYWGEPFPIRWIDGIAYPLDAAELPLSLPHVDTYGPGPDGAGPLANIASWNEAHYETNTMPGYAGSSWYFLRYMDPHNATTFADPEATKYWNQVDIYIGGTEHAVGHLLYSRMWTKVLYDLGHISFEEPFKKLINQGMIQGSSRMVYKTTANQFVSLGKKAAYDCVPMRVDVNRVNGVELDIELFKQWRPEYQKATFICEDDGRFICDSEVEKMSKSKYNVVNPDDIIAQYGADTFRMYEMFLGPIEMSKPWDTKGIEGVYRFLRKFWRLFYDEQGQWRVVEDDAQEKELKLLHKCIQKIEQDTERFSFNTAVAQFMIVTNELHELKCYKRSILEPLVALICPYAPHIAENLWQKFNATASVILAPFPKYDECLVQENSKVYPVAINGKTRLEMEFALDEAQEVIEQKVLAQEKIQNLIEGKAVKKIIFVKGKMINIVIA